MFDVHIEPFKVEMTAETSRVLARAFVANPQNMAAFGPNQLARNETFFRNGLAVMKGTKLVAIQGSNIVGFIHWVQSPACQLTGMEKLKTVPAMVGGLGLRSALRLGTWLSAWERYDPKPAHLHLGPIGVDPAVQGHRIGQRLMGEYCRTLDQAGIAGYLETDRPGNVGFYHCFGFETVKQVPVLGVPNFLMQRIARPSSKNC